MTATFLQRCKMQGASICDYPDYCWGKGTVGPNIQQSLINGWWYI